MPSILTVAGRPGFALALLVTGAVPAVAFANLVLNHFYVRGAQVFDAGLLAWLVGHGDPALPLPRCLGPGSYFAIHTPLLFVGTGVVLRLAGTALPLGFAWFVGAGHALLALGVFWLAGARSAPWRAAALGLGVAFSGLAIALALFPHYETLIPVFFLLFAAALRAGRIGVAAFAFALGLTVREDAGLHYAAILAASLVFARDWAPPRRQLAFAVAGVAYALAAAGVQHAVFGGASSFARVYSGTPPYAHLTLALLRWRLAYFLLNRAYLVGPAIGCAAWAILARKPALAAGWLACLPWLALHLTAITPLAGTLASYYAFPCLIAFVWPLVVATPRDRPGLGMVALVALSFLPAPNMHNPGRLVVPRDFLTSPNARQRTAVNEAVARLAAAHALFGRLLVDQSVAALAPDAFTPSEMPFPLPPDARADTVLLWNGGYDADRLSAVAAADGLTHQYEAAGTRLRLATRAPIAVPASLGLAAVP